MAFAEIPMDQFVTGGQCTKGKQCQLIAIRNEEDVFVFKTIRLIVL